MIKKARNVPKLKVSETQKVFEELANDYNIKSKEKFDALNRVSVKLIDELDFLRFFKNDIVENIEIDSTIIPKENTLFIRINKYCNGATNGPIHINVRDVEESEDSTFFNLTILYSPSNDYVFNDKVEISKACKVIAIFFYLLLVEKMTIDCIKCDTIQSILNKEVYTNIIN